MRNFISRLKALLRSGNVATDVSDELAYHLEREQERNIASGMSEDDAWYAAKRSIGNVGLHVETARDAWRWAWLDNAAQDIRYGIRALRRSPIFTATAVISIALGVGANTAVFSIIYNLLFTPLAVPSPSRLVVVRRTNADRNDVALTSRHLVALRSAPGFVGLTEPRRTRTDVNIQIGPAAIAEHVDLVDGSFFSTIALPSYRGRYIAATDVDAQSPVAVISHGFAERHFASADSAIGRVVLVRGRPITVIGVTPAAFRGLEFPGELAIAVPSTIATSLDLADREQNATVSFGVVGRLAPSVTMPSAQAAVEAVFQHCCRLDVGEQVRLVGIARGITRGKVGDIREEFTPLLLVLFAGVGVVLLIACANVGGLLLVRGAARAREIAVRRALGASRLRIVRQMLTESALLAAIAAPLGLALAFGLTTSLSRWLPGELGPIADLARFSPSMSVLIFSVATCAAAAMLFGIVPAIRTTRPDLVTSLKSGGGPSSGSGPSRLDRGIVVVQTALTLVLVTGAALLVATARNLERVEGGYARSNVIVATIDTRGSAFEHDGVLPIHADVLRRVRALSTVTHAAMASEVPLFGGMGGSADVELGDGTRRARGAWPTAITSGYFSAAGVPIIAGRDFTSADNVSSERVAVISLTLARSLFGDRNPLGALIRVVDDSTRSVRVVGLAADVKLHVREAPSRILYVPTSQSRRLVSLQLLVRVGRAVDKSTIAGAIVAAAPGIRAPRVLSMARGLDLELLRERIGATFATLFGALALILASIGIYGVVAYGVSRRTTEIGIRMALGAHASRVVRTILLNSLVLVGTGIALGAPVVYFAGRALDAFLYGLDGHDPIALLVSAGVLIVMATLASAAPAWRAARIEPVVALRVH